MRYFGGKSRLAKYISPVLQRLMSNETTFIEPFVGGGSITCKIKGERYCYDIHKGLINLYNALQNGWIPPSSVSEQEYKTAKRNGHSDALTSFIGFGCSYSGKYFGGYARGGSGRNYALNAKNSILKKMEGLHGVVFKHANYIDLTPIDSVVYCDPPYKGTTQYSNGKFDTEQFWETMRIWSKNNIVVVSEYNAPDDFVQIWSKDTVTDIRTKNGRGPRIEKLFVHESIFKEVSRKLTIPLK